MNNKKLDKLIFQHYSKSALLPILIIEILLLILYFAINSYTNFRSKESLRNDVQKIIPHFTAQQIQQL